MKQSLIMYSLTTLNSTGVVKSQKSIMVRFIGHTSGYVDFGGTSSCDSQWSARTFKGAGNASNAGKCSIDLQYCSRLYKAPPTWLSPLPYPADFYWQGEIHY